MYLYIHTLNYSGIHQYASMYNLVHVHTNTILIIIIHVHLYIHERETVSLV